MLTKETLKAYWDILQQSVSVYVCNIVQPLYEQAIKAESLNYELSEWKDHTKYLQSEVERLQKELDSLRKCLHREGLEFALLSEYDRQLKDGE